MVALDAIRDALDVDATDNQGEVIRWIELFTDYTARIEIVYLEPPIATILAQNKRRTDPVPETVILRLLEKLEPPTLTECHILTLV